MQKSGALFFLQKYADMQVFVKLFLFIFSKNSKICAYASSLCAYASFLKSKNKK